MSTTIFHVKNLFLSLLHILFYNWIRLVNKLSFYFCFYLFHLAFKYSEEEIRNKITEFARSCSPSVLLNPSDIIVNVRCKFFHYRYIVLLLFGFNIYGNLRKVFSIYIMLLYFIAFTTSCHRIWLDFLLISWSTVKFWVCFWWLMTGLCAISSIFLKRLLGMIMEWETSIQWITYDFMKSQILTRLYMSGRVK